MEIDVELPAGAAGADGAELVLVRNRGAATRSVPAVVTSPAEGPLRLRAVIPLSELAGAADVVDRAGRVAGDDGMAWDVYIKLAGRPRVRVAWPEGMPESRHLFGGREAVAGQSRYGDLVLSERSPRPVIDEHEWQPDGRLVLRGSFLGAGLPGAGDRYETVLRRIGSADSHVIGFQVDGERFSIEADLDAMPFFGSAIPLRDGEWNLYVRPAGGGAETLAELKYDHDRLGDVAAQRVAAGRKWYRLMITGHDDPLITAEPRLRRIEQGNFAQRALRRGYYPSMRRTPVRESVFFVSWKGKQCGDNPLGIAEELRRRGDDREQLWAVTDWSVPVPEGGTGVLRGTEEYYEALARSRYLISNDDMQAPFRKRDGQVYLQTWHGTPLKRIGFDISNPQFISGTAYFDHLAADIAQWDLLLSPNPFSTPVMRRAFRYDGEICEYGYPRNDLLSRADTAEVAARVRDRLGLPDGKRVVLYAPTWRDNQVYANGRRYRFDMRLDLERAWRELGQDHVFLIRGHHHMADDVPAGMRAGFAINVTAYPDITELFLVSDVLVTDYSSAMFDYAVTGRPIAVLHLRPGRIPRQPARLLFRLRSRSPRSAAGQFGRGDRGRQGHRLRRRLLPRRLPAFRGQVLLAGRRQGGRPHLRPPLYRLIRRAESTLVHDHVPRSSGNDAFWHMITRCDQCRSCGHGRLRRAALDNLRPGCRLVWSGRPGRDSFVGYRHRA